ncbi:hypothetical protein ACFE04_029188 [Oxalis oulophora]
MASSSSSSSSSSLTTKPFSSQFLLNPNKITKLPFSPSLISLPKRPTTTTTTTRVSASTTSKNNKNPSNPKTQQVIVDEEEIEVEVEVEEDLPWIQEKALDLVEFTGSVSQAIPGPRVGQSSLPWIVTLPIAYVGVSFVIAFVKTVRKFTSPKAKRRRLVSKNAVLIKYIDELLGKGQDGLQSALRKLVDKTGFSMVDILRKYIRFALNEKPFKPELVLSLIHLRKATMLDDSQVGEVLNDVSRRIVKEKGPVVMNMSGFTQKGLKRKVAVQALFGKVFYLAQLREFCSKDSSLIVKEIFGVTDEDAEKIRLHTLSDAGDMDSLEKMVVSGLDGSVEDSSDA